MNNASRKKLLKRILVAAALSFAALLVVYAATRAVSAITKTKTPTRVVDPSIRFAEPDYEYDIFSDPKYVSKQRNITWSEYGETYLIGEYADEESSWHGVAAESVYASFGEEQLFFRNFFVCLIKGDHSAYPSFFSQTFFKNYTLPAEFTSQKIYDISVEVVDRTPDEQNGGVIARFILRYRIMNNNGTYRGDVASDSVRPVSVTVSEHDGVLAIESLAYLEGVRR